MSEQVVRPSGSLIRHSSYTLFQLKRSQLKIRLTWGKSSQCFMHIYQCHLKLSYNHIHSNLQYVCVISTVLPAAIKYSFTASPNFTQAYLFLTVHPFPSSTRNTHDHPTLTIITSPHPRPCTPPKLFLSIIIQTIPTLPILLFSYSWPSHPALPLFS
jgi:hypothetical protein